MSYSTHRKAALDAESPLAHRVSHVRSCAKLVAAKCRSSREEIASRVKSEIGVDLGAMTTAEDVTAAMACIDRFRAEA